MSIEKHSSTITPAGEALYTAFYAFLGLPVLMQE
jgi:hypothetical protein